MLASQNSGFNSLSRFIPVMKPFETMCHMAEWAMCPNFWWASLIDIFAEVVFAVLMVFLLIWAAILYSLSLQGMVAIVFAFQVFYSTHDLLNVTEKPACRGDLWIWAWMSYQVCAQWCGKQKSKSCRALKQNNNAEAWWGATAILGCWKGYAYAILWVL